MLYSPQPIYYTAIQSPQYHNFDSPAYQNPKYVEALKQLKFVSDIWNGDNISQYLPKESKEPAEAYAQRLARAYWAKPFKRSIQGFAGLLTDFQTVDIPASLNDWLDDIDGCGNTLTTFLNDADERVLRDGSVAMMVDFPSDIVTSVADEMGLVRRPYLKLIDARNIINTRYEFLGGRLVPTLVVIKELDWIPKGLFGEELHTRYRVIRFDGNYDIWEVNTGDDKRLIASGRYSIGRIPIVFYKLGNGEPPLLELAETNEVYCRIYSDYLEIIRKCNLPVPVRKGFQKADLLHDSLIIGTNHFVDLPPDGDFYFAEPTGAALGATRMELERFEVKMLQMTLGFALANQVVRTATETEMMSAPTKSSLKALALRKQSAVEQIFSLWSMWENQGEYGGTIEINKAILSAPLDPVVVDKLIQMVDGGLLSKETALRVLQEGSILPRDVDIKSEIRSISSNLHGQTQEILG